MTTQPAYTARKVTDDDIGQKCPYAGSAFQPGDELAICLSCQAKLLRASWVENKGCTSYGCEEAPDFRKDIPQEQTLSLRDRRLNSEHEGLVCAFKDHDKIMVRPGGNNLPEKYEIDFHVNGLERTMNGELVTRTLHTIEVVLPSDFPRRPPVCKMKTPIFHPNIDVWDICTSDHWAAQETIVDLVVRIGQMITYQTYNTKSPLNAEAAMWCDENVSRLPVDSTDIHPPEPTDPKELLSEAVLKAKKFIDLVSKATTIQTAKENVSKAKNAFTIEIGSGVDYCDELFQEQKELLNRLTLLSDSLELLEKVGSIQESIDTYNEAYAFLNSVEKGVADLLESFNRFDSPVWIPNGSLDKACLDSFIKDVFKFKTMVKQAIDVVRKSENLPESGKACVPEVPTELACLHQHVVDSNCKVVAGSAIKLLNSTKPHLQSLQPMLSFTEDLQSCFEQFDLFNEIIVNLEDNETSLGNNPDSLLVAIDGKEFILRVGSEVLLRENMLVRCRLVSSTGNISLSDVSGKHVVEFQTPDNGLNENKKINEEITAKLISDTSKHIFDFSEQLLAKVLRVNIMSKPQMHSSLKSPDWLSNWSPPVTKELITKTEERAILLRKKSKNVFRENRMRTYILIINTYLSLGKSFCDNIIIMQDAIKQKKNKIQAIIKRGKILKNGALRLPTSRIDEYEKLINVFNKENNKVSTYKKKLIDCKNKVIALKLKLNTCNKPNKEHLSYLDLVGLLSDLDSRYSEETT
ncbi:hypothetical protein H8D29_00200, partial [PVC group bacterium]|nr:hypothetical protein [PVC group bacterium]